MAAGLALLIPMLMSQTVTPAGSQPLPPNPVATATIAAPASARGAEQERLKACLQLTQIEPEKAYDEALAWVQDGGRPAARHCKALALIELGRYDLGAGELELLANDKNAGTLAQRGVYLAQAGNAWMLANKPEAAAVTLANAIKLAPRDAALRVDRGKALLLQQKWADARTELSAAIQLSPGDSEALRLRGFALLKAGKLDDALKDAEASLKVAPTDELAAKLRGDILEAKRKKKG